MRILFIDTQREHARRLHADMLSYRALPWDLQYCDGLQTAVEHLQHEEYDVLLLCVGQDHGLEGGYAEFVGRTSHLPSVVLLEGQDAAPCRHFVKCGAQDALLDHAVNGPFLMRRLRLAITRHNYYQAVLPEVLRYHRSDQHRLQTVAGDHAPAACRDAYLASSARRVLFLRDGHAASIWQLGQDLPDSWTILEDAAPLADYLQSEEHAIRALVIEQGWLENHGLPQLKEYLPRPCAFPSILLLLDRSDAAALAFIEQGLDDCLLAAHATAAVLDNAIELSQLRIDALQRRVTSQAALRGALADRRETERATGDRRQASRYLVTRPLLAIPVLPQGAPDERGSCEGFSLDVSTSGIGFQIASQKVLPSRNWLVGVECSSSAGQGMHYAHVVLKNVSYLPGAIRLGTQFAHPEHDLLQECNRLPQLDPRTQRLRCGLPETVLRQWAALGVLQPRILERIKVCPACGATAAVGDGCRDCGSARLAFLELIHHFACAYVGRSDEFESHGELACPKCLVRGLVVGADLEVVRASYRCLDCGFEGSELETVGACLHCRLRFPLRMASEAQVWGYYVERLDVLAFLGAAT